MATDTFQRVQKALDRDNLPIGASIPIPERKLIVGNGNGEEFYMLADIGIDRLGRLWRQDLDGLTLIADLRKATA